ncbi:MAG: hypothetical protein RL685_2144 [Pseudomonadota bacterium]
MPSGREATAVTETVTSTSAHRLPKPAAWLALPWLLAACANVLGIEERKIDTAANYPADGYTGCLPGSCGGCLEVHRQACQAATTCAEASDDDCTQCVCSSCEQQVIDCKEDAGCTAIWECLRETRCDLSERAQDNCLQACGSTIQASGGVNGASFRAAAEIRSCAATSVCLTCLAPQVQQASRACTQANGCQCESCFDQCLCSGERFGECQRLCATEDAPSSACSEDDDCAGCNNCFNACACGGGAYAACTTLCSASGGAEPDPTPNPADACDASTSCVSCADCTSQCTCSSSNTIEQCEQLCAPPADSDQCIEYPRGTASSCEGCQGCIAQCTCPGQSIESCRSQCQEAECCGSPGSCNGSFSNCLCAQSAADCFAPSFGTCESFGPCEACACQQCPGELGMCLETVGCQQTFDCMRATSCEGSACLERCRNGDYGPQAFVFAEALWACYRGNACDCGIEPPASATCSTLQGDVQCDPFVGSGTLQACCSASNTAGATLSAEQSLVDTTNPCGLELQVYLRDARACEPRTQPNLPRFELLETCPDRTIASAPYSGALLQGCCREDHTCGYFDDITGLGCLSAGVFGQPSTACN